MTNNFSALVLFDHYCKIPRACGKYKNKNKRWNSPKMMEQKAVCGL